MQLVHLDQMSTSVTCCPLKSCPSPRPNCSALNKTIAATALIDQRWPFPSQKARRSLGHPGRPKPFACRMRCISLSITLRVCRCGATGFAGSLLAFIASACRCACAATRLPSRAMRCAAACAAMRRCCRLCCTSGTGVSTQGLANGHIGLERSAAALMPGYLCWRLDSALVPRPCCTGTAAF